jgi:Uma2 family endonuclease
MIDELDVRDCPMTQRTARLQKPLRSPKPDQLPVVWPASFRVSERGFEMLCRANPDVALERDANGKVVIMAPANMDGGERKAEIIMQLGIWNKQSRLGVVFDSSAGLTLPNTAVRAPDTTWITRERWDAVPKEEKERFSHIIPDFVVELRSSKKDGIGKLRKKMTEYMEQGVRLGWLIDPKTQTVEIYRPGELVRILEKPSALSGEDVLPGFVLDLKDILDL